MESAQPVDSEPPAAPEPAAPAAPESAAPAAPAPAAPAAPESAAPAVLSAPQPESELLIRADLTSAPVGTLDHWISGTLESEAQRDAIIDSIVGATAPCVIIANSRAYIRPARMSADNILTVYGRQEPEHKVVLAILANFGTAANNHVYINRNLGVHLLGEGGTYDATLVSDHARGTITVRRLHAVRFVYEFTFRPDHEPIRAAAAAVAVADVTASAAVPPEVADKA
jgi:hypothetical protein